MSETLLQELRSLEETLLQSDVRKDRARLDAILHVDFVEIGRSGRRYDRDAIIRFLLDEQQAEVVQAQDFVLRDLGEDCALLSYVSVKGDARSAGQSTTHRTSIWRRTPAGWQLFFHQGTACADSEN